MNCVLAGEEYRSTNRRIFGKDLFTFSTFATQPLCRSSHWHSAHTPQMSIVIVQVTCSSSTVSSERRFDKGLTIATLKVCDKNL